jgi:hypothetical protein
MQAGSRWLRWISWEPSRIGNCLGSESEGRGTPRGEAVVWVELCDADSEALHRELKLHCVTAETSTRSVRMTWTTCP